MRASGQGDGGARPEAGVCVCMVARHRGNPAPPSHQSCAINHPSLPGIVGFFSQAAADLVEKVTKRARIAQDELQREKDKLQEEKEELVLALGTVTRAGTYLAHHI